VERGRLLRYAGIGAAAIVVVLVGTAAFISMQGQFQLPTAAPTSSPCSPAPCASVRGFTLWVSDLKVDAGLVSMQLTFRNSSSSTHADPADLQLVDAQNRVSSAVVDAAGCTAWTRTEFNNGRQFGPVSECFQPASTSPPLTLRWSPDFGLFCCQLEIPLEAG
jgi:hypothetical protein